MQLKYRPNTKIRHEKHFTFSLFFSSIFQRKIRSETFNRNRCRSRSTGAQSTRSMDDQQSHRRNQSPLYATAFLLFLINYSNKSTWRSNTNEEVRRCSRDGWDRVFSLSQKKNWLFLTCDRNESAPFTSHRPIFSIISCLVFNESTIWILISPSDLVKHRS